MVEPKEAAEIIREVAESSGAARGESDMLHKWSALLVAILASLLAVATISTGAATRRLLNDNIHLTDLHSDANALTVQEQNSSISADILQSIGDTGGASADLRTAVQRKVDAYHAVASELQGDASKGTGIKGREAEISQYEGAEEETETQILSFEYSEVTLQVGIVLGSVAILAASRAVFFTACGLGVVGLLLGANGFFLRLPFLH